MTATSCSPPLTTADSGAGYQEMDA